MSHQIFPNPAGAGSGTDTDLLANDLDVTITDPREDHDVISWNASLGFWANQQPMLAHDADVGVASPNDGDVLTYDASLNLWLSKAPTGGVGGSTSGYTTTLGDGVNTSYVINHALHSTEILVQVHETTTLKRIVDVEIDVTDSDNVTVVFATAPALNDYTIVVLAASAGGGGGSGLNTIEIGGSATGVITILNFLPGTDIAITNPGAGTDIQIDFTGTLAATLASASNKWLNSYDAVTGLFTQTQPDFTDLSGIASTGQIPNLDASKITTGLLALARGGTGVDLSASGGTTQVLAQDASHVVSARNLVAADLPNTAVTPGSYSSTNLTVDAQGRITAAANGTSSGAAGSTVSSTNDSYTAGQRRTYDLTMAKSFLAWKATEATGKMFRLQLYETSAARTADASRPYTVPLQLGTQHGCLLDLYIEQSLATTPFNLSPPIVGSNNDVSQASTIYWAITSVETTTQNIQVTISYVGLES